MMDDLDDSLDDLLGGHVVGPAKAPPANYKPIDYSEPCKKCGGSGRFRSLWPVLRLQGQREVGVQDVASKPRAESR
jgi:hypothetical protein